MLGWLASVLFACVAAANASETRMTWELSLQAPDAPFHVQEAMPIRSSLRNTGAQPQPMPAGLERTPWEYVVTRPDGTLVQAASHMARAAANELTPRPRPVPILRPGGPGQAVMYQDDMARMLVAPLLPGAYGLTLRWRSPDGGLVHSNTVTFEVLPPRGQPRVQSMGGLEDSVQWSRLTGSGAAGAATLAVEQADVALTHPTLPRYVQRAVLPAHGGSVELSVAIEADMEASSQSEQWIVVVGADALHALTLGAAHGSSVVRLPWPDGWSQGRVEHLGWQLPDTGEAVFLAAGVRDGALMRALLRLRPVVPRLSGDDDDAQDATDQAQEGDLPPARWIPLPGALAALPEALHTTFEMHEQRAPTLRLSWVDADGQVATAVIDAETASVVKPPARWLSAPLTRMLAWRAAPRAPRVRAPLIQLVSETTSPEGHMVLRLSAATADGATGHRELPALPAELLDGDTSALRWVLPQRLARRPAVAVVRGDAAWWLDSSAVTHSRWRRLMASDLVPESLRLWCARDATVHATWHESTGLLRQEPLR